MLITKYYLTNEQADYLRRNPAKYWTNKYSGETSPQYHVEVEGVEYWVDLCDDNEITAICNADLVWNPDQVSESDMADILSSTEYEELADSIAEAIERNIYLDEQLRIAFRNLDASLGCEPIVSADQLWAFVNKLNKMAIEGASK